MKKILILASFIIAFKGLYAQTFTLSSADLGGQFTDEFVAGNFGCSGHNLSPELHWTNPPTGAKSFAVTMYDPDAPTGSGFWHWIMVNIPVGTRQLKRGAGNTQAQLAPKGSLQSINDTGAAGYQGPCPPEGDAPHRYVITIYALNTDQLDATSSTTAALCGFMLNKASIAKASLIVYAKR